MATWEAVPQAEMEQRPVSRWSEDNDTPMAGTHTFATYIPPYRILERFRGSPVGSRRGSGQEKDKGMAREALEDLLQRIRGWRTGLVLCSLVCALVLGLNVATTVLSVPRINEVQQQLLLLPTGMGINNQVVTFYQGDCGTTRTFAIVLRLVINILATILLAGANYCMQILVSPTRGELDLVHRHKRWLWVGVPNLSNLPHIGIDRAAICLLLIVGTLPLHLLWNAALVETIGADDYYVGGVTEDFFASSSSGDANVSTSPEKFVPGWFQGSRKNFDEVWLPTMRGSGLANLTAADCIRAYGSAATGVYGNVALVFGTLNDTNSFLLAGTRLIGTDDQDSVSVGFGNSWVCGLPAPTSPACDYHSLADNNSTSWTPLSHAADWSALASADPYLATLAQSNVPVKYCMAQPVVTAADGSPLPSSSSASSCRLASLPILQYAVLGANALQLLCLVGTWFAVRRRDGKLEGDERIVTSGDLIASYLRDPDLRFAGRCLASARMVKKARRQRNIHAQRRRRGSATTQQAQVDGRDEAAVGEMTDDDDNAEDEEDINVGFWNSSQPMPLPWNGRSRRRTTVLGSHEKAGFTLDPSGTTKAGHRLSQLGCFGQPPDDAETRMMEEQGRKTAPRWHTGVPGFFARQLPPILVVLAILGLFFGFRLQQQDLLLAAGFGQPSLQAIAGNIPARLSTSSNWGAALTALVANTPQLLGAYVYLTCNAALTAMLAHAEVSRFAVRRGGLRVSVPRPDTAQRSAFHLHLPLHMSLPLLMGCAALHWLLGESLFLLRVAAYDGLLRPQVQTQDQATLPPRAVVTAVGYSATPLLATAGLLALLVGVVLALGWFRRYMGAERMPLFATCSASLAAATCPTSSFFFPQVVAAGSGGGYGAGKTAGGGERGGTELAAAQQRSRVGSWVEAVGLTTGTAVGVGLAHGHPSRDELGVLSTPDPIEGSYAYYRVRRFEGKLSEHGLAWGTVDDSEPVHHATFSLGPVLPLEKGQFYA